MEATELNAKVQDQLEKALVKILAEITNDLYRKIIRAIVYKLMTDTYIFQFEENICMWKHVATFRISGDIGLKTSVARYHLNQMEKKGLVRSLRSSNNILWSIENLEGFEHSKYKDYYELTFLKSE